MLLITGAFDQSGSPTLRIRVTGDITSQDYEATLDTGFTGFVAMPINEMVALGLKTAGAATVTLGDGSTVNDLLAPNITVGLGPLHAAGAILLSETSTGVLVGMDFLRSFKLALILTGNAVILYDEAQTLQTVVQFMAEAPSGMPNTSPTSTR